MGQVLVHKHIQHLFAQFSGHLAITAEELFHCLSQPPVFGGIGYQKIIHHPLRDPACPFTYVPYFVVVFHVHEVREYLINIY